MYIKFKIFNNKLVENNKFTEERTVNNTGRSESKSAQAENRFYFSP